MWWGGTGMQNLRDRHKRIQLRGTEAPDRAEDGTRDPASHGAEEKRVDAGPETQVIRCISLYPYPCESYLFSLENKVSTISG